MITRCAETDSVPPARGVMVKAVELSAGLRTVSIEFMTEVCTMAIPTICEVPVALPTTVYASSTAPPPESRVKTS